MGLDISVYSKCQLVLPEHEYDDERCWPKHVLIYAAGFPERLDGLPAGCYTHEGEGHGFRAGSYSGYNHWRAQLCRQALGVDPNEVWEHAETYEGAPFLELINMSDCEGAIGPVTSKKLAADFASSSLVEPGDDPFGYFLATAKEWRHAFELASDSGWVVFH